MTGAVETGENVVVMYHSVNEAYPDGRVLTGETFESHLDFLTENFRVVDLPEVFDDPDTERKAALTFDAGYENFYTEILPYLREYELPATQFVIPERIGHRNDEADSSLWIEWFDFMDHEQVADLVDGDLVTVGNKSLTHVSILPALRDESVLEREVRGGKERLEELFGITAERYCYGSGRFDRRSVEVVREHHDYAVTTEDRFVDGDTDPATIPRITADFIDRKTLEHRTSEAFMRGAGRSRAIKRLVGSWFPKVDTEVRESQRRRDG